MSVRFSKIEDEDNEENIEYDFEWAQTFEIFLECISIWNWFFFLRYDLDDGNTFRGRTHLLNSENIIYILIGAHNTLYWVEFSENEYESQSDFTKIVRLGKFFFKIF